MSRGDHKALYTIVKELTGQRPHSQQIKLLDGRFVRMHEELVNRWKDHFQAVFNCPEPTTTLVTDDTDASMELPIKVNAFLENEVRMAIKQLKNRKAPGMEIDQNGTGVWPNASTWMRVKSRSRSRINGWSCEFGKVSL